jgi:putative tryptophan/tyrosine transport system substrate-binding protein
MRAKRYPWVALLLLATLLPAAGQVPGRVYRVGVLVVGKAPVDLIRQYTLPELALAGFVEGRNLVLEVRSAEGDPSRLPVLARELSSVRLDLVIAGTSAAIGAARDAMPRMPVVMSYSGDPVLQGFATSLARPGGMLTGIALQSPESDQKRLEVMRQLLPVALRFGVLMPAHYGDGQRDAMRRSAARLGVELVLANASSGSDYEAAFAAMRAARAQAVVTVSYPIYVSDAAELARRAIALRLPLICEWRESAASGCLLAFGPSHRELRTRTANFVVRILRGEAPGEIPIEQPTKFELTVNLKTAKAIGVTLPQSLLVRADEVFR